MHLTRRPKTLCHPANWLRIGLLILPTLGCQATAPQIGPAVGEQVIVPSPPLDPKLLKTLKPSNDRDWTPEQARLARAEFHGSEVTVRNIRNCTYPTAENPIVEYYDQTFDLNELESVDFIVVPFPDLPGVGHTMLSFGFGGRDYLAVSVEIRRERGEKYSAVKGFFNQYELIYVVGDERDLIRLRTEHHMNDVYVYRTRAKGQQVRALFEDVMSRANRLADSPEFYHTLTNNCTTNIRRHINRLSPDRIPYDFRVLLPANSDRLAYELGLLRTDLPFEETKRRARVNELAYVYRDDPNFSVRIRR